MKRSKILNLSPTVCSLYIILIFPLFVLSQDTGEEETFEGFDVEEQDSKPMILTTILPNCDEVKMQEVRAPATKEEPAVLIDCNLTLRSSDVITKRMIFEGLASSGAIVDGNGAMLNGGEGTVNYKKDMIAVNSREYTNGNETLWERAKNITVKNFQITGSVRITGIAVKYLKEESRKTGYVEKTRASAPKNIVFDHLTITGVGRNPVFFNVGVTSSQLINSEVKGKSDAVAIYLNAESKGNIIRNNYIHTLTADPTFGLTDPLIAIDGSSYNIIIDNRLSSLHHGGINLYRNCGEKGIIRHSTPSHNMIINNIFYYDKYKGVSYYNGIMNGYPSVYLSSRDGAWYAGFPWLGYCDDDDGYDFGSSKSNKDYAMYNVVMQNQIYKLSPALMIASRSSATSNYIDYNETVTKETEVQRLAGCYATANGYKKDFVLHGESIEILKVGQGEPTSYNYTCNDGQLTSTTKNSKVTRLTFDCAVNGDNNGCEKVISCPGGQKIIGATAASNLEQGTVSDAIIGNVPTNYINVVKESDNVSSGLSWIGNNQIRSGQKMITGVDGLNSVSIGCRENDVNGGDCHIKVILYCRLREIAPFSKPPIVKNMMKRSN
jgi:hypothetical protein